MFNLVALIEWVNFQVPGSRWQFWEICDLWIIPPVLKHCCQNTLTAQWTKRLPFIQRQSPAELAAAAILDILASIPDITTADWTIIDFCSGAGGPIPVIEALVNRSHQQKQQRPLPFRLSDLHPNIDAWLEHAARSANLSFIPQSVDATDPPFSVISSSSSSSSVTTTTGDRSAARPAPQRKVFRLFCLSFHHFDDAMARKVLKSTLDTSDAFAIVELQERRLGSLLLMLLEFGLLFFVTVFWFWGDWLHLVATYVVPLLPAIHAFDGFVSCLRTRTFEETMELVEDVDGRGGGGKGHALVGNGLSVRRAGWVFRYERSLHTWPMGYMSIISGRKIEAVVG